MMLNQIIDSNIYSLTITSVINWGISRNFSVFDFESVPIECNLFAFGMVVNCIELVC